MRIQDVGLDHGRVTSILVQLALDNVLLFDGAAVPDLAEHSLAIKIVVIHIDIPRMVTMPRSDEHVAVDGDLQALAKFGLLIVVADDHGSAGLDHDAHPVRAVEVVHFALVVATDLDSAPGREASFHIWIVARWSKAKVFNLHGLVVSVELG